MELFAGAHGSASSGAYGSYPGRRLSGAGIEIVVTVRADLTTVDSADGPGGTFFGAELVVKMQSAGLDVSASDLVVELGSIVIVEDVPLDGKQRRRQRRQQRQVCVCSSASACV